MAMKCQQNKKQTGWEQKEVLETGLQMTIDWYLDKYNK